MSKVYNTMTAELKTNNRYGTDIEYDMQRRIFYYFYMIWWSGRNVKDQTDRQILQDDLQVVLDEDMSKFASMYGPEYVAEYLQCPVGIIHILGNFED